VAAFTPYQQSVGTAAVLLAALPSGQYSVAFTNAGTNPVYLGNSQSVTTTSGAALPAGATWVLQVNAGSSGQSLYAVAGAGTNVVTVFTGA
jgi:hypothetical protein